jgi:predicted O-methyltransferase YrrM
MREPWDGDSNMLDRLAVVEQGLASHPIFGDSGYIQEQMGKAFGRRLEHIAERVPAAYRLIESLQRASPDLRRLTLGDTVLRCAIKCAQAQVLTDERQGIPLGICEGLFEIAIAHLQAGRPGLLADRGRSPMPRIGDRSWHGAIWNQSLWDEWLWDENRDSDLYDRAFRFVINEHALGPLTGVDEKDIEGVRRGQRLLESIVPILAKSASSHTHTIGVFRPEGQRSGTASSSQFRLTGTIFINRDMFRNPWQAAEHMFHEFLHQKLYDLRSGHTLLADDFSELNEPLVCSLWNTPGLSLENMWNTHRAMAAFHVYVHLALMARIAECRIDELQREFGPMRGMISSRHALDRAQHLGLEMRAKCAAELGFAGTRLLDWMMSILDILEYDQGRKGASSHLLLGRYLKEAKNISSVLKESETAAASLAPALGNLAHEEVQTTCDIIGSMSTGAAVREFSQAVDGLADKSIGARFADVRALVARTLLSEFGHDGGAGLSRLDRDGRLVNMIESGSERLLPLTRGLPGEVVAAKRRAEKLHFHQSCLDDVGRLLAMLAAAVPRNGRVLEIGTGAGFGLAWIIAGMRQRVDVAVVSIEADPATFEAVRACAWPAYVTLIEGDATGILPSLGKFDLIFADASPMKFQDMSMIVEMLREGGTLLVDDLCGPSTTSKARSDHAGLRAYLSHHPDLQSVFLNWSTGLLLASRHDTGSIRNAAPSELQNRHRVEGGKASFAALG